MFVNNGVGTVQQIYDIQDIIAETNAYFHVDAGSKQLDILMLSLTNLRIDTVGISAHKFGGPKVSVHY